MKEKGSCMTQSFRAFMEKIIDYAGLFPPAKLPMKKAVANYNRYRECQDAWMLSHFICPAAKLGEFEESVEELIKEEKPFLISSLGRKTEKIERFLECIQEDVTVVGQFTERNAGKVVVDVFEFCLPPGLSSQPERLEEELDVARKILIQHAIPSNSVTVYYEIPLSPDWQEDIDSIVHAISRLNRSPVKNTLTAGFKFRCGGVKADQFPSVEQMVCCITTCRDAGVRLKLTAGLHHPFRHFNESVQTKMHGFINIVTAALLGRRYELDAVTLTKIIEDEDGSNFRFEEQTLSWKDLKITSDQIAEERHSIIISFGCCSFDEPRKDLQRLGLLP
jgi:hypothetical protein